MTESHARRSATGARAVASPAAADMIGMFVKRNPHTSRDELEALGRATAAFGAEIVKLTAAQQKRLAARKVALRDLVAKVLDEPAAAPEAQGRILLSPSEPNEISHGSGLGEPLAPDEGRRRVHEYALASGVTSEDWAGVAVGPVEIERRLGVARSTLHAWQSKGLVIGLLNGLRKNVFPLEQFVDGKPIAGVGDVLRLIGEPRTAWMWLKEPHPLLNGVSPLALLKRGRLTEALEAARANFDQ
jgi:hypothetical protein